MKFAGKYSSRGFKPLDVLSPVTNPPTSPIPQRNPNAKSLNAANVTAPPSVKSEKYTGKKMIGVGVLHKSNLVPIFSEEEARDIARMRR